MTFRSLLLPSCLCGLKQESFGSELFVFSALQLIWTSSLYRPALSNCTERLELVQSSCWQHQPLKTPSSKYPFVSWVSDNVTLVYERHFYFTPCTIDLKNSGKLEKIEKSSRARAHAIWFSMYCSEWLPFLLITWKKMHSKLLSYHMYLRVLWYKLPFKPLKMNCRKSPWQSVAEFYLYLWICAT